MPFPGNALQGSRGMEFSKGGSSHLIRSAEKLAASGRYDFAVEQLNVARQLDPGNQYIEAIIDRIRVMQGLTRDGSTPQPGILDKPTLAPLAVTVGPQFPNGIKSPDDEQELKPEEIHTRIRFLTNQANQYLEGGSSEKAFHSLMKAYLLDPLSPYVVAAEKTVLPAWESRRTQKNNVSLDSTSTSQTLPESDLIEFNKEDQTMAPSPFHDADSSSLSHALPSIDEQLRMETLRQQKEQERVEKERAMWREASKPPKTFGEDDPVTFPVPPRADQEEPKPQATGLFARLRLGKFLE